MCAASPPLVRANRSDDRQRPRRIPGGILNKLYAAYPGELVTLSGGTPLDCNWQRYKDGIMMCELPEAAKGELDFTQLFVNGRISRDVARMT